MGRAALAAEGSGGGIAEAGRVADDGSVTYGGRRYEGPQAQYILAALGARRAATRGGVGAREDLDPGEYVEFLSHEFLSRGLQDWPRLTLDQVACYFRGRARHWDRVNERVQEIAASCEVNKTQSPIRFTVPFG